MTLQVDVPKIELDFADGELFHIEILRQKLLKALPKAFFENQSLEGLLPFVASKTEQNTLSLCLLYKQRQGTTSFIFDLISRWLIPNKKLNVDWFFSVDFRFPDLLDDKLTFCEIILPIESERDLDDMQKNLSTVETELRFGVSSDYYANRIMKFKGLSTDRKTALVQEKIGSLMRSHSKDFGQAILTHMQHFLVTCSDDFKNTRDHHHISRVISVLFLLRKLIRQKMLSLPNERHLLVKFLKTKLLIADKEKPVLGLLVGLNFLKEHEVFAKEHLFGAAQSCVSGILPIESSFFLDRKESIETLYLEIEKKDGMDFSSEDIQKLRLSLPSYLQGHIEQLVHPIFMQRNEEEVVRNMLLLSRQLRFVHDLPQLMISFDPQVGSDLSFTVIMLRVGKPSSLSLQDGIKDKATRFKIVFERIKRVGLLRQKYIKEANVFRVILPAKEYLRSDQTIDLQKARQEALGEIVQLFGEVRDYNGGMICKQNEIFASLKTSLGVEAKQNELLLEKYFYSIIPVEMTVIGKVDNLKNLFLMLLNAIKREETRIKRGNDYLFKQEKNAVFVIVPLYDLPRKKSLTDKMQELLLLHSDLLSFSLSHGIPYEGFAFFSENIERQKSFLRLISEALS